MKRIASMIAVAAIAFACKSEPADAGSATVDPTQLYDLSTEGSTAKVKAGEQGKVVLTIKTKNTGHLSAKTPFKLSLKSDGVALAQEKVKLEESKGPAPKPAPSPDDGPYYENPRFEVPFTAKVKGETKVDAVVDFFICADEPKKVCIRAGKQSVQVPVTVL